MQLAEVMRIRGQTALLKQATMRGYALDTLPPVLLSPHCEFSNFFPDTFRIFTFLLFVCEKKYK